MENFVFDVDYIYDLACKSEREKIRKKITESAELGLFSLLVEPGCITKDTVDWLKGKKFAIYETSFGFQISWEKKDKERF